MRAIVGVLLVTLATAGTVLSAPPAPATPATGVTATVLWQRTDAGVDYTFREITIAPGGGTGWHWHDGRLYGVIKQGTLTHSRSECSLDGVYNPGDAIFEPSGPDHVHDGRNLGNTPLVMQVLYILPAGKPLSEDAPDPGCAF